MKRKQCKASSGFTPGIFISGEAVAAAVLKSRPANVSGKYAYKWDYLEKEILSKYVGPDTDAPDLRAKRAIAKLMESEESCAQINNNGYGTSHENLSVVMHCASNIVAEIMGCIPRDLFEKGRFSGGASTTRQRKNGHPYFKYDTRKPLHVTPSLRPYAEALITATPLWCAYGGYFNIKERPGNRVTTVPKKTDIDRAIAIEPDLNMHMQTAVGDHIRGRLKVAGIDLNDQSRNQRLAKFGSRTGLVSTIDLSAASDSVSYRLVWDLLPPQWFDVLDKLRSPIGELPDGKLIKWEKFSSMGNGFTFELESLIFYAITKACYLHRSSNCSFRLPAFEAYWSQYTSVYGDDIVCPSFLAEDLIKALSDVGFKTNEDKTFYTGSFRESCGKHYYANTDVSPFYIRKPIDSPLRVIWLLNKVRKWAFDESIGVCDPSLHPFWLSFRRQYCPADYLGGVDIDSDSSVYSTEQCRYKLLNKVKRRRVGGYRAFLARAQRWGSSLEETHYAKFKFGAKHSHLSSTGSDLTLCTIVEGVYVKRLNTVLDTTLLWSPKSYLFPKEIR